MHEYRFFFIIQYVLYDRINSSTVSNISIYSRLIIETHPVASG